MRRTASATGTRNSPTKSNRQRTRPRSPSRSQPGPLYHVASIEVLGPGGKPLVVPLDPDAPRAAAETRRSGALRAGRRNRERAAGRARAQGHPVCQTDRPARRRRSRYADDGGDLHARPGPRCSSARRRSSGLERLDPGLCPEPDPMAARRVYDNRKVDETRRRLIESGLFSTVKITPVADPASRSGANEQSRRPSGRIARSAPGSATTPARALAPGSSGKTAICSAVPNICGCTLDGGQQEKAFRPISAGPIFSRSIRIFWRRAEIANDTPVAYHSRHARSYRWGSSGGSARLDAAASRSASKRPMSCSWPNVGSFTAASGPSITRWSACRCT